MSFIYDEELPAGYQDADIEQAEFEAQGRALAAARKRGICTHGWQMGRGHAYTQAEIEEHRKCGAFPDRPTADASAIPEGMALCLDCGEYAEDLRA